MALGAKQRIAAMRYSGRARPWVVFKVDVAHHPVGAAHQVAGKGLAQAGALVCTSILSRAALAATGQHGLGACGHGGLDRAERRRLLWPPQVAHDVRLPALPARWARRSPRAARSRRCTSVAMAVRPPRLGTGISTGRPNSVASAPSTR